MSLVNPWIKFYNDPNPWTPTTNWVSLSCYFGRQNMLDTYGAGTGEIVFRRTSSNSAQLAKLKPDQIVEIKAATGTGATIKFRITDIANQYSIASNADFTVVTLEGGLGLLNRQALNSYSLASGTISAQISTISTQTAVSIGTDFGFLSDPSMDAATVTSPADWLQKAVVTVNARIDDSNGLTVYDKYTSTPFANYADGKNFVFTDNPTGSGLVEIAYDEVEFASLSQNYFNQAIVDPDGHAAQVSTAAGATQPYRVLALSTFNYNTAQAQDYADYLVNTFSDPQYRPSMISVNGQSTDAEKLFQSASTAIGSTTTLTLRGTTYNCVIEGWAITADPSQSRYTFYVSGADLNAYLILDDTDRGVLDANRLGY